MKHVKIISKGILIGSLVGILIMLLVHGFFSFVFWGSFFEITWIVVRSYLVIVLLVVVGTIGELYVNYDDLNDRI